MDRPENKIFVKEVRFSPKVYETDILASLFRRADINLPGSAGLAIFT